MRRSLKGTEYTAPGQDGIHYTHLKHLRIVTTRYIAKIYETCSKLNYFLDLSKTGLVAHQIRTKIELEQKQRSNSKNLRPITLIATLGKVIERIVSPRIQHHIVEKTTFYLIASQV